MGENFRLAKEIAQIAALQHGNVSRPQLRSLGLGDPGIHRREAAGMLHRVFRGVYAVGRPAAPGLERAAAAGLACGSRAALSHGSAMTLWGFWQRWEEPFEVTVADDRRPTGIRIHRSSTLLRRDVVIHKGIRVTSPARTLLDTAPRMRAKSLRRAINDGRRKGLLTLADLADVATRCPSRPGAPLLNEHVELNGPLGRQQNPTRSPLEDDLLSFCRRYGLPTPLINATVEGHEVDAYFPVERLVVECDGWEFHSDRQAFEGDRDRDATLLGRDVPTVRITHERLHGQAEREAARLHAILERRRGRPSS